MRVVLTVLAALLLAPAVHAPAVHAEDEPDFSKVEFKTVPVAGSVSMLRGEGGNIALSVGPDGPFLVDDEYAPLTPKLRAAVARLTPRPIRFVLNTHWHGDHTGGNRDLGGRGVLIVAHENVRVRMGAEQLTAAIDERAAAGKSLPVVTFTDAVTLHLNGDDIEAFHVAPAHTDGDSVVWFKKADVVHTGDLFFNGMYPFIDVSSGGSIDGMIAAEERLLDLIGPGTRVIPGHGPLATRADLQAAHDMLVTVRDRVAVLVQEKKTLAEALAAEPVYDLDAQWGKGYLSAAEFVEMVYADLSRGTAGDAPEHALAEAAVREAVLAANRAYAENDMPEYWATYAPDLTLWLPEGRVDLPTYRRDWTQFLADGGRVEAAEVSDLVIQVSPAADTAVASYVLGVRTREVGGDLKEEVVHETDVWMRRGGAWAIVHLHYTPVSTKTTPKAK